MEGVILRRFPRWERLLPYGSIERVEVYLRRESQKRIPDRAVKQVRSSIISLRDAGYKLRDYTNSDEVVVLLLMRDNDAYLILPKNHEDLIKCLRRRVKKLPVRWMELTRRERKKRNL